MVLHTYKVFEGHQLYDPLWESVSRLERLGFKVMGLVCDGLTANRRLFKLHVPEGKELVYSVPNPYTIEKRLFFFLSDSPHLLKMVGQIASEISRYCSINLLHSLF